MSQLLRRKIMGIKIKLKDMSVEQFRQFKDEVCRNLHCDDCIFNYVNCVDSTIDNEMKCSWVCNKKLYSDEYLNKEVELPIPERDRKILELIPKQYKYIARDRGGILHVYVDKPYVFSSDSKEGIIWGSLKEFESMAVYNDDFKYIKSTDKEPTLIEDLLKE